MKIYSKSVEAFETQIQKLNKKAEKYNVPAVTYTYLGIDTVERIIETFDRDSEERTSKTVHVQAHVFNVEYYPVINGYKIIGALDHVNRIHIGGNPEVFKFSLDNSFCQHCNTNRQRNITTILQNITSGEYIQVGSTCLNEFVNHKALACIEIATYIFSVMGSEESLNGCAHCDFYLKGVVQTCLNEHKKNSTYENKFSRDYTVTTIMAQYKANYTDEINSVVEHFENLEPDNSFLMNVKNIFQLDYVNDVQLKFIVPAIYYHLNAKPAKNVLNEYYGDVNSKCTVTLTIKRIFSFDGQYGTSYVFLMEDNEGRVFKWSTNKRIGEIDDVVNLTGTIKAHDEYRGIKQTVITRCKVL